MCPLDFINIQIEKNKFQSLSFVENVDINVNKLEKFKNYLNKFWLEYTFINNEEY
jgi:hypothetical protein